jgi:predicted O-methyltransferase YrrM
MHLISSEVVTHRRKDMHIRVKKHSTNIGEYFEKLEEAPRAAISPTAGLQPVSQDRRPPNRATITATRINRLAALRGARRYLEVGVARGQTFLNVEIELKHGVDPAFRFDTRPLESERVRFFAMTSDRFFTEAAPRDMRYDIIFLDGLHTFEQTFRDFCASMPHAHADTVWIIDDVFPSDVFSALPSQQDALAYRKQHGLTGTLWHGDVFKCVFAINDFFPNFSFRTLRRTHGNPQTVIVNRPRPDFRPVFNDLEKISRLDYYGFWENRRLLRLDSEDAIFDWLDATLKPA